MDIARKELKEKKTSDSEKGVLEKLLEIDERIAVLMVSDMLFAGVDTVRIFFKYQVANKSWTW